MECPACKVRNGNHRSFCWKCRFPMALHCPHCGSANKTGTALCGGCGKNLLDQSHPVLAPRNPLPYPP
ncbi:MAG: zinc ribbon domain-containing protein [Nitrospirae bacterium]|nr:zinc ribbon domain-containing protein [Candidatus Manganitrophaceae bacterium]